MGLGEDLRGWEGLLLHGCFSLCWIFLAFVFKVDSSSLFFPSHFLFFSFLIYVLFLFVLFLFRLIIYVDYGVKERKGQQSLDVFE
jgi:hypothetical protein